MLSSEQTWSFLGEGSCNIAYINDKKDTVLKIKKTSIGATDLPERAAKLWTEINGTPAEVVTSPYGLGWTCPYIEGKQASDEEISHVLIDIYIRTSRIVIDAPQDSNVKKTRDGNVICVDVGAAYLLESRPKRRQSIVSIQAFKETSSGILSFLKEKYSTRPLSVDTMKALFFIQSTYPDMNIRFLRGNKDLIEQVSEACDYDLIGRFMLTLETIAEKEDLIQFLNHFKLMNIKNLDPTPIDQAIQDLQNNQNCDVIKARIAKLYDSSQIATKIASLKEILEKSAKRKKIVILKKNLKKHLPVSENRNILFTPDDNKPTGKSKIVVKKRKKRYVIR